MTAIDASQGRPRRRRPYSARLGFDQCSLTELVTIIQSGDDWAWQAMVDRLSRPVWGVLSGFDVDRHLRNDAAAETWKSLYEHLDNVRDPESLPGWAGVVAANHMRRILRRRKHLHPCDDIERLLPDPDAAVSEPDRLVEAETRCVLSAAVERLSPREQAVVRCRTYTDEPVPLARIEADLGIPAGSVGPTLGRSMAKLRNDPEVAAFFPAVAT
ncbi:MAG: sigma-70 family RNA polymerase sigma factor [Actinomycetota bacterium]